jgi:transposase
LYLDLSQNTINYPYTSLILVLQPTAAECSERSVKGIRSNIHYYGTIKAPPNSGGRPRSITPLMIDILCEHLLEKPGLYLEEMATFLCDEFDVLVSTSTISRALKARN